MASKFADRHGADCHARSSVNDGSTVLEPGMIQDQTNPTRYEIACLRRALRLDFT
jgi:hypothetical protein